MACQTFEHQLIDYLENALPAEEHTQIQIHLSLCPKCAALTEELARLDRALLNVIKVPRLSPEFASRLQERIRAEDLSVLEKTCVQRKHELSREFEECLRELRSTSLGSMDLVRNVCGPALIGFLGWLLMKWALPENSDIALARGIPWDLIFRYSLVGSGVFMFVGIYAAFQRRLHRFFAELTGTGRF